MFRIKNTRNSTVAKHNNIPPPPIPPSHSIPINNNKPPDAAKHRQLPTRSLLRRNENLKMRAPIGPTVQSKIVLPSRVRQRMPVMRKGDVNVKRQMNPKKEEGGVDDGKQVKEEQKKVAHVGYDCPQIAHNTIEAQQGQPKLIQQQALQQQLKEKQRSKREQQEELAKQAQKQRIARQDKRRMEEQEEAQQIKQRQLRLHKQQEQEQASNDAKMQEMMQKVNARRRAREQERERRMKLQRQAESQQVGGVVALSDPLAHVEMGEAVMDAQVNMLLRMKFAGYPNREAIEQQVEQLERINRSYLLVRTDPNNPLIRGLSNFRIQLFNRVGELIMQAQAQLGPTACGLQVIEADSRNCPPIKGMEVTRGMEGHFSKLNKEILQTAEQCAICLCEVGAGTKVYAVGCGHKFHEKCLQEWLKTSASCPACRYNIKFGHA